MMGIGFNLIISTFEKFKNSFLSLANMGQFAKYTVFLKPEKGYLPTCSLTGIRNIGLAYSPLPFVPVFKIESHTVPKEFGGS